jgi:hypothetical protein
MTAYLIDDSGLILYKTNCLAELALAKSEYEGQLGISGIVCDISDYSVGEMIDLGECYYLSGL